MKYGSLINLISDTVSTGDIEVGTGATILKWTDRDAATVVEVVRYKSGSRIGQISGVYVTTDKAVRVDSNGMSESQQYEFTTQWDAERVLFTRRGDGRFVQAGGTSALRIGSRDKYYDFSF